jgi:hypothetical protein
MRIRAICGVVLSVVVGLAGAILPAAETSGQPPLTVHEWGTFTTVAGPDGRAQDWVPLGGPTDLPCFVERYKNGLVKVVPDAIVMRKVLPDGQLGPATASPNPFGPLLDYEAARRGLKGTVRMETPVVYFYAAEPTNVRVDVSFPKGLFTEWYPKANVVQPPSWANVFKLAANNVATLAWPSVSVKPGTRPLLPGTDAPSHYYAARDTDAAPIEVNGQPEKFLFYRGVGGFGVPIAVSQLEGRRLHVRNLGTDVIPAVVVFTSRGGKIGFRVHRTLDREATFEVPRPSGDLKALRRDLSAILVAEGLYPKEAEAMINTWRDTWFEEGTRVLYIVPKPAVEAMLPLNVAPKPDAVSRVFVGRMDVIAPEQVADVRRAIGRDDRVALSKHGRLLGVIGERILETTSAADERLRIEALLKRTFLAYVEAVGGCN